MSDTAYLVGIVVAAVLTIAILTTGTLASAGIIGRQEEQPEPPAEAETETETETVGSPAEEESDAAELTRDRAA